MSQFKINASGSLVREGGSFARVSGPDETRQHVRVRCLLIKGEVPWSARLGVRYFGGVLAKGFPIESIVGEYRNAIEGTPGVGELLSIVPIQSDDDRASRRLAIDWTGVYDADDLEERRTIHDRIEIGGDNGSL